MKEIEKLLDEIINYDASIKTNRERGEKILSLFAEKEKELKAVLKESAKDFAKREKYIAEKEKEVERLREALQIECTDNEKGLCNVKTCENGFFCQPKESKQEVKNPLAFDEQTTIFKSKCKPKESKQ